MCLDEEGWKGKIEGIPGVVVVREISFIQLMKSSGKDVKCLHPIWRRHPKTKWKSWKTIF
jgi:hypothetical protein